MRESAKLRALRAKNLLTCQRVVCSRAHVPTCLACLITCSRAKVPCALTCSSANVLYVLSCSNVNMSCVLMSPRVNVACELTCSCVNMPWVPFLEGFAWPRDYLPTCFASLVSSFDTTFLSFNAIVVEVVHTVFKV